MFTKHGFSIGLRLVGKFSWSFKLNLHVNFPNQNKWVYTSLNIPGFWAKSFIQGIIGGGGGGGSHD